MRPSIVVLLFHPLLLLRSARLLAFPLENLHRVDGIWVQKVSEKEDQEKQQEQEREKERQKRWKM